MEQELMNQIIRFLCGLELFTEQGATEAFIEQFDNTNKWTQEQLVQSCQIAIQIGTQIGAFEFQPNYTYKTNPTFLEENK